MYKRLLKLQLKWLLFKRVVKIVQKQWDELKSLSSSTKYHIEWAKNDFLTPLTQPERCLSIDYTIFDQRRNDKVLEWLIKNTID